MIHVVRQTVHVYSAETLIQLPGKIETFNMIRYNYRINVFPNYRLKFEKKVTGTDTLKQSGIIVTCLEAENECMMEDPSGSCLELC